MESSPLRVVVDFALRGEALPGALALTLLPWLESRPLDVMAAARLAMTAGGRPPFACGIINAKSGRCGEDCAFCAQSAHYHTDTPTYPLVATERLLTRADELASVEADYIGVVTSGGGPTPEDFARLLDAGRALAARPAGPRPCASFGMLGPGQAEALRAAGFVSYHHNLETARSFYPRICATHDYDARVETVRRAKAAGLRVCSGGLFGMGECWEQRIELAATLAALKVDSVPINFLTPVAGTPLADRPPLAPREALAIIALFRLMLPERDIVICGGRPTVLGEFDRLVFSAGANGLMVGDYLTTPGGARNRDALLRHELASRL